MITQQTRKIPNWECPGLDGVQDFWLKNLPALHERIVTQMDDIINKGMDIPKWMTGGKTIVCLKDPGKGMQWVIIDQFHVFLSYGS